MLTKEDDVTFLGEGDVLVNKRLASTLRTIQMKPNDFYVGDLAKKIVADVTEAKGGRTSFFNFLFKLLFLYIVNYFKTILYIYRYNHRSRPKKIFSSNS